MKAAARFIAAATLAGIATAAAAQGMTDNEVAVTIAEGKAYQNDQMKTRLFLLGGSRIGNRLTVRRAKSDDVLGVLCEWKASASIDDSLKITDVDAGRPMCRQAKVPEGMDKLVTYPEWNILDTAYGVTYDGAADTITERALSAKNRAGVQSHFRRIWDFKSGKVCLDAKEWQDPGKPYVDYNMGCWTIPADHPYVKALRARVQ